MPIKMKSSVCSLLILLILNYSRGQLQKQLDFWYIHGKGCGISTEIKYLTQIPTNIDGLSCVIIKPKSVKRSNFQDENSVHCSSVPFIKLAFNWGNHQAIYNIASAGDCRKICQDHVSCEVFIWVTPGPPLPNTAVEFGCLLKWGNGPKPTGGINERLRSCYKNCIGPEE